MSHLTGHFHLLIHTILYGIFLGLFFDTIQLCCRRLKKIPLKRSIFTLFWLAQIPMILLYFYHISHGVFQSYLIIFIFFGAFLYFKFLQVLYLTKFIETVNVCFDVIFIITRIFELFIIGPIYRVYLFFRNVLRGVYRFMRKCVRGLRRRRRARRDALKKKRAQKKKEKQKLKDESEECECEAPPARNGFR